MPLLAVVLILADTTLYRTEEKGKIGWIKRVVEPDSNGVVITYLSPESRILARLDSHYVPILVRKWHRDTLIYELTVNDSLRVRDRDKMKTLEKNYPFYDRHTLDFVLGRIDKKRVLVFLPEREYEWVRLYYDDHKITLRPENFFFALFGIKFEFWFDDSANMVRYQDAFGRKLERIKNK
ncbi:hypothetical protein DRP53_04140 [candidate division WOR-3 bacterium]|uniref:Uncharacterized protein n=1 Tax=candidate division WOR-3 bacterium TaxID=2052148 RepID=A0A660SL74_UNCW3|nr:MAG: hypothetical protein DRP53_04140 [candidate division WOR-3 bacterium]